MGFQSTFRDPRSRRLADAIEVNRSYVALRRSNLANCAYEGDAGAILDEADEALKRASTCNEENIDSGWAFLNLARQLQVPLFDQREVTAGGKHIEAELAAGQFPGWRGKAIEAQVIQVLAASNGKWSKNSDERTAALADAWELRNESLANRDFDSALTRRYQAILICVALAILIIAVFGSAFVNPELNEGVEEWWVALASALAGALGGSASALQRTTRRGTTSTAIKVGYLLSALSRPVIGAIGGITVFLAVRAGATQTSEEQVAYVLLVSFGAGFFERLVVRDPREELALQSAAPSAVASAVLPSHGDEDGNGDGGDGGDGGSGDTVADAPTGEAQATEGRRPTEPVEPDGPALSPPPTPPTEPHEGSSRVHTLTGP